MVHNPRSESAQPASETELVQQAQEHGRHRPRRLSGPATAITAGIAAGSLALATYAVTTTSAAPDTEKLTAAISRLNPEVASSAVTSLGTTAGSQAQQAYAQTRELRAQQGAESFDLSADLLGTSLTTIKQESTAISREKAAAAKKAAEKAAEKAAAERAAAEKAAAAEAAAAERAAAKQEAADRATAEQASRSQERTAPASAPQQAAPAPAPAPAPVSSGDARSIARSMLGSYGWGDDQWGCLDSLWQRESGWNHRAMNASSGAYGIPQSLPGSKMATAGADWQTNPATQITWGLGYISGRYGSPCNAWAHSESVGWY